MLLLSDKLVIMKIITCALVIIFIITRLSDDNITLTIFNINANALSLIFFINANTLYTTYLVTHRMMRQNQYLMM